MDMLQARKQAISRVKQKFTDDEIDKCEFEFCMYQLKSYSDAELIKFHVLEKINN